jgi:ferredoxin
MRIVVGDACAGHGVCESIRPDLFEVGEDGIAHVVGDLSDADREDLLAAVEQCPTQALKLED